MTTIKTKHTIEREWDVTWSHRGLRVYRDGWGQNGLQNIEHERELPPVSDYFPAEVHAAATREIRANRPLAQNEWRDPETRELHAFEVSEDGTMVRRIGWNFWWKREELEECTGPLHKAMRDYLRTHGRPSYIPEGSHWGWVTDGLGRRVGAYVYDGRFIRVCDQEWRRAWWPDVGFRARVARLTPELSDQCQALWDSRPQGPPRQPAARTELLEQLQSVKEATDAAPAHARENYEQAKRAEERLGYLPQEKTDEPLRLTIGEHGQPPDGSQIEWVQYLGKFGQRQGIIENYGLGPCDRLVCNDTEYRILRSGPALKAVEFDAVTNYWFGEDDSVSQLEAVKVDLPPGTRVHVVVTPLEKLGAK